MTTQEILSKTGLDWEVNKLPLFARNEEGTEYPSNYFGIVRSDNQEVLSTCKATYTPVQNLETIELLHEIADRSGLEIVKGGPIQGGKKLFVTMKDLDGTVNIGPDTVEKYIFAINSHDGSTSLAFGTSNTVQSCQNQFFQFYKKSQLKFRHTKAYRSKVDQALHLIELGKETNELGLYETFKEWARIEVKKENVRALIQSMEDYDINMAESRLKELHSTRKINKVNELHETILKEMNSKGHTAWGLFNGITYYTNHIESAYQRENGREEKLILGTGYRQNNKAFQLISEQLN